MYCSSTLEQASAHMSSLIPSPKLSRLLSAAVASDAGTAASPTTLPALPLLLLLLLLLLLSETNGAV